VSLAHCLFSSTNPKHFIDKYKKKLSTNPKIFIDKSKKFRRQIQNISSTNPKKIVKKSKKNPEIQRSKTSFFWKIQKALENPVVLTSESHL